MPVETVTACTSCKGKGFLNTAAGMQFCPACKGSGKSGGANK